MTSRNRTLSARRGRKHLHVRRGTALVGATALTLLGVVASSPPAFAVHDLQMQLDGNTSVGGANDPSSPPKDWESFFGADVNGDVTESGALTSGFLARGHSVDYPLPDVTTYSTGSKDTLNIGKVGKLAAGWQCGQSNNLGAKDDLMNVYTIAYRVPHDGSAQQDHLILYFGAEKSSNLGDNNIGIWFMQDANVGCAAPDPHKNVDWTGHHTKGDVLLTAAFTNGGGTAAVEARTWQTNANPVNGDDGFLSAATSGFLCTTSPPGDSACAITNDAANQPSAGEINPPWNHPAKTPGSGGSLAAEEFYEGGVDVTQLENNAGNTGDPCITTFVADTRSSQSPTATLFDYAAGSLPVCHPATKLTVSVDKTLVHSGDSVTWTAVEQNTGTSPISNVAVHDVAGGTCATFTPTLQAAPDNAYNIGDTNKNGILDPGAGNIGESWTFTCPQTLTASTTIHLYGSGTDTISGKTIAGGPTPPCTFDDTKNPPTGTSSDANTICDPNERATASVTVIHPSTTLTTVASGKGSPPIVHVNDTVTYTFYEKNDGDVDLSNPSVTTDDSTCNGNITSSGDIGGDGILSKGTGGNGETWTFTCTTSYATAGTGTIHAVGHGSDPLGVDVTYYQVNGADCTAGSILPSTPSTPAKFCDLDERTSASVLVINPSTYLREGAVAVVTFTYLETNDGDSGITTPFVDSSCAGASAHATQVKKVDNPNTSINESQYNVGDTDNDGVLDGTNTTSETWTFTCTKTVSITANNTVTYTDSSTGHGTDAAGSTVDNTTDTDEADSSTVTVTNNPPN
jgi:hypothetical protein